MAQPTLLLVHGGFSGAWAWDPLAASLNERNLKWKAIDRVGSAGKKKPGWTVSAADVANDIVSEARRIDGPVLLVGHSAGGMAISGAAEAAPDDFVGLVYLTAYLPVNGERLLKLASQDDGSDFGSHIKPNVLKGVVSLNPSCAREYLFHDCPDEGVDEAIARFGGDPIRLGIAKTKLTAGFDSVPKHYLACTEDRALSPAFQKWMADRQPVASYSELQSGHMPMNAQPNALADRLAELVER